MSGQIGSLRDDGRILTGPGAVSPGARGGCADRGAFGSDSFGIAADRFYAAAAVLGACARDGGRPRAEAADERCELLDFAETLGRLDDLMGEEVVVELRPGGLGGTFHLAARGVLLGPPVARPEVGRWSAPAAGANAFMLDSGGFLTLPEDGFVFGEWYPGSHAASAPPPPRLSVAFEDAVLHVTVVWGGARGVKARPRDAVGRGRLHG